MANLLTDIETALAGQAPTAIVVAGWADARNQFPQGDRGKQLNWNAVKARLNFVYNPNLKSEAPPVYIWTATHVIFVGTAEGRTWVGKLPLSPADMTPTELP